MIRTFAHIALFMTLPTLANAQAVPFDMSGERPAGAAAPPPRLQIQQPAAPPSAPQAPQAPPPTSSPPAPPPFQAQRGAEQPALAPVPPEQPVATQPRVQPSPAAGVSPQAGPARRYLVPMPQLELRGEYERRQWTVYLTAEEARSPAALNFAYQNAVVVAPEASQIRVFINNRQIAQQIISSPDGKTPVRFDVPRGLLQPGENLVRFEAAQRHRTDCTIQSTYDLWATLDPAQTFLSFSGPDAGRWSTTDAIQAIGVDQTGTTEFSFLVPSLEQPQTTRPLLRLSQGLGLLSAMPNEKFSFSSTAFPVSSPGHMAILVGTVDELQPFMPTLPAAARTGSVTSFVADPRGGKPLMVITGPNWDAVGEAIGSLVSPADRPLNSMRTVMTTQRWSAPDVPMISSNSRITLATLGVTTKEFSGRRFRTDFNLGVPADFYANAYGEMTILLDAAYTEKVKPGSHIDIYVNGNIASVVPITSSGGGLLRHLPIRLTMRHFKPGLNLVSMEAVLLTDDDAACAPGATALPQARFVLFDTSEVSVPDFARIGQRPNLAALAGTGFPYSQSSGPLPVYVDRFDQDTLSAAAMLLAEMASAAGRIIPVETVSSAASIGDRDAIFLGSISQIPATVLTQLDIATSAQASWRPTAGPVDGQQNTAVTLDEWRSKISGGILSNQMTSFEDWLRRNFDISLRSLRFLPAKDDVFAPSNSATVMVAQGASPGGSGTWTVVAAPSPANLREGVEKLAKQDNWSLISGHVTTFSDKSGKIESVPASQFEFVPTVAWSFTNIRLVVANWLSSNILFYAFLFVILSVLTGIATSIMLSSLGRRK